MSATTLLRRTATVLTATAIAVPTFGALGGTAFAAQPTDHDKTTTAHENKASHGHSRGADGSTAKRTHAAAHGKPAGDASTGSRAATAPKPATPVQSATAANSDPRGNNGTVFIHDVAGDHHPHNIPHVGCTFYVDFFGFDSDQMLSTSFVGQAPTGAGTPLPSGDWTGTMPANGASGAGRDFDAEQAFTLDTSVLGAPQAQQGYHVKLTVSTGEPGGVKHKVFWINGCTQPTATAGGPAAPVQAAPATHGLGTEPAPQVLGLTVTRQLPAGVTRVLGMSAARTPSVLPFTGAAGIGILLVVAGVALAAGGALLMTGRRRTT